MDQGQSISQKTSQELQPQPSSRLPLILIGFVLILAAGAGGVYLGKYLYGPKAPQIATNVPPTPSAGRLTASPTTDPTSNWKTYTNGKYDYSLKHPASWTSKDEDHGSFDSKLVPGSKVSVVTLSGDSSTLQIFFEGEFDHGLDPWSLEKSEDITLDGRKAKKNTFWLEGNPVKWIIVKIDNFHDFRIEMQGPPDTTRVFDYILSTFRFLDKTTPTTTASSGDTVSWKTFRSKKGYTIKYPESLTYEERTPGLFVFPEDVSVPTSQWFYIDERGMKTIQERRQEHIADLTNVTFTDLFLSGTTGYKVSGRIKSGYGEGLFIGGNAYLDLNGRELIIGCDTNQVCTGLLDTVLSTFQLVEW